jgi:hypothetical protein
MMWETGCAAEGMAVLLAVKDHRPLRGACGVLDREPLARHRQKGPAGKEPASGDAAQPFTEPLDLRSSFRSSSHSGMAVPGWRRLSASWASALCGIDQYPAVAVS